MRTKITVLLACSMLAFIGCHGVIAVGKQKITLPSYEPAQLASKNSKLSEKIYLSVSVDNVPQAKDGFILGFKKDAAGRNQGYIYTPDALGTWIGNAYKAELISYGYYVNLCSKSDLNKLSQKGIHINVIKLKQYHKSINAHTTSKVTMVDLEFHIYHKGKVVDSFRRGSSGRYEYSPLAALIDTTDKLERSFLISMKEMTNKSIPLLDRKLQNDHIQAKITEKTNSQKTLKLKKIALENKKKEIQKIALSKIGQYVSWKEAEPMTDCFPGITCIDTSVLFQYRGKVLDADEQMKKLIIQVIEVNFVKVDGRGSIYDKRTTLGNNVKAYQIAMTGKIKTVPYEYVVQQ